MHGLAVGGLGFGASRLEGIAVGGWGVGAKDTHGLMLGGVWNRIEEGEMRGVMAAGVLNQIKGHQNGLAIALVNYARTLHGVQLGLINIVRDNPSHKVLPVANWNSK
jgi:hypothetical protein